MIKYYFITFLFQLRQTINVHVNVVHTESSVDLNANSLLGLVVLAERKLLDKIQLV